MPALSDSGGAGIECRLGSASLALALDTRRRQDTNAEDSEWISQKEPPIPPINRAMGEAGTRGEPGAYGVR